MYNECMYMEGTHGVCSMCVYVCVMYMYRVFVCGICVYMLCVGCMCGTDAFVYRVCIWQYT